MLCLSVDGRNARLIGVVTRSNDIVLPVDTLVVWQAQDNGEGDTIPDAVSRPSPIGSKLPRDSCRIKFPEPPAMRQIVSGNIQVQ